MWAPETQSHRTHSADSELGFYDCKLPQPQFGWRFKGKKTVPSSSMCIEMFNGSPAIMSTEKEWILFAFRFLFVLVIAPTTRSSKGDALRQRSFVQSRLNGGVNRPLLSHNVWHLWKIRTAHHQTETGTKRTYSETRLAEMLLRLTCRPAINDHFRNWFTDELDF